MKESNLILDYYEVNKTEMSNFSEYGKIKNSAIEKTKKRLNAKNDSYLIVSSLYILKEENNKYYTKEIISFISKDDYSLLSLASLNTIYDYKENKLYYADYHTVKKSLSNIKSSFKSIFNSYIDIHKNRNEILNILKDKYPNSFFSATFIDKNTISVVAVDENNSNIDGKVIIDINSKKIK